MGPARSPDATLAQLLEPEPKQATMKAAGFATVAEAMKTAGLPYRMSEGNSCWDGGKPGVSDTLASALWCADTMLRFASMGWCGVNLHGGGNGFYTPIAGAPSTGFTRRPEYFGIQFAQTFAGWTPVSAHLETPNPLITAYVFDRDDRRQLALINKSAQFVSCHLPPYSARSQFSGEPLVELSGPAVDAASHVQLRSLKSSGFGTPVTIAPYTARTYQLVPFAIKGGGPSPANRKSPQSP